MVEPLTSEELVVAGCRCRFNLGYRADWFVVGPVRLDDGSLPSFEMPDAWPSREDAVNAVKVAAARRLGVPAN
ncbi:MAG TPA: hypothetical protein VJM11_06810 [Nevskiaceae bacterium]|nr:hypothetical protein [Nevskiaceae bacterium]